MMRRLLVNLHWKALSLAIALALWLVVVREPELVTAQSVPIFYKNLPKDLEIGSDVVDRVHVEIRGAAGKLTPASLAESAVVLDLSPVQAPGERTFPVSYSSLNLPPGVAFLRAVPSQLHLSFDRLLSKEVPVQIRFSNPPAAGYRLTTQDVRPDRLRIAGAENRVRAIESAHTDPIDLAKVVGRANFRVHAYLSDPQVRFDGPAAVTVRVAVDKSALER